MQESPATGRDATRAGNTSALGPFEHVVGFHESEEFLAASVVDFLTPALEAGEKAVLIATAECRERLVAALSASGVDVGAAYGRGQLVVADATGMLAGLMLDGAPDPDRFRTTVGGLVETVTDGRHARIYGEMVSVLWQQGDLTAAIELERLWNELAESAPFALLCSYPISGFDSEERTAAFGSVCDQHSAVIPAESYSGLTDPDDRARAVALLQQETSAGVSARAALEDKQAELEAALVRLRELEQLRSEFVAMVAHDIQGPSVVISGLLELLRDTWPELDHEEVAQFLTRSIKNARQIRRLADDILTMARLDSGEFTYDLRPLDLAGIVERTVAETRATAGRRIDLSVTTSRSAIGLVDEDRQIQILTNLLSNAVKFSPPASTITVIVSGRGDHLEVAVRDEGVGIAPPDLGNLFRPFRHTTGRSDGAPTTGTGLGLYIAKILVEGQGGTIEVDSTEGEGSTFSYSVPSAEPPAVS